MIPGLMTPGYAAALAPVSSLQPGQKGHQRVWGGRGAPEDRGAEEAPEGVGGQKGHRRVGGQSLL